MSAVRVQTCVAASIIPGGEARRRRRGVSKTPRADHGHHVAVGLGHVRDARVESNFPFVLGLEGRELGAAGAVGAAAEEPRFYYIC